MQMKTYLFQDKSWNEDLDRSLDSENTLIILFACTQMKDIKEGIDDIVRIYPKSTVIGSSTPAEIYENEILYNSITMAILRFDTSHFKLIVKDIEEANSYEVGKEIVNDLPKDNLKSIFVLANVLNTNGSELTKGLSENIPKNCVIAGGLVGDGVDFNKTWLIINSKIMNKEICAVGLYGNNLQVHYGCKNGWTRFGFDRHVTHSENNILYSLDNKPALELYKRYLGEYASELPLSGLYFPLMLHEDASREPKLRSVKAINEKENSIIFAGNIPQNSIVSFGRTNLDDLIKSSQEATECLIQDYDKEQKALCIGISGVGRKFVLKQEAEDEIEAVSYALSSNISTVGFYSYGQISKLPSGGCDFHNQTMTLLLIYEMEN
ncbi:FIST N-terminal domain-containing protein [Sulfurimonas sp.]|uniref:FIST signal transduction protein n=1 Tax=Sulfurimonas sp. TaxID=2022749 RepID=UPI0025DE8712|nr:FIST N-terminal domain-containing protein [Sulfurimonas sp.]